MRNAAAHSNVPFPPALALALALQPHAFDRCLPVRCPGCVLESLRFPPPEQAQLEHHPQYANCNLHFAGGLRCGLLGIWAQAACLSAAIVPSLAAKLGASLPAPLVRICLTSSPKSCANCSLCA